MGTQETGHGGRGTQIKLMAVVGVCHAFVLLCAVGHARVAVMVAEGRVSLAVPGQEVEVGN